MGTIVGSQEFQEISLDLFPFSKVETLWIGLQNIIWNFHYLYSSLDEKINKNTNIIC